MAENSFDKELITSNLLGATNLQELHKKEKVLTNTKMLMLKDNPVKGSLDYTHLKNIHRFIFLEVFTWAGKDRYDTNITAQFGKGSTLFTPYEKLPTVSRSLFDALKDEDYFTGESKEDFIESASVFMNGLNILHPFREGNGRVQRIYMGYLAKNAGFILNFQSITADEMVAASIEGAKGDTSLLRKIFSRSIE